MTIRWPSSRSSRRTLAAILTLVVLDLVLVALAFGSARPRARPDPEVSAPRVTAGPARSPSSAVTSTGPSTGAATPGSTEPPASGPVPTTTLLVALGGDVAWRGAQGACDGGAASVSVTTDGGRTWSSPSSPARVVLRLVPTSEQSATVVGAGADCAPTLLATSSAGSAWAALGGVDELWYRDVQDLRQVHAPGSAVVQPCEGSALVIDLAPLSTAVAQVLCADGSVRTTADRGASWPQTVVAAGALALDTRREAAGVTAYLLRVDASCPGVQVARARTATEGLGCLTGASVPVRGALALSVNGDNGWVQVGDQSWRSSDGLRTWVKS